MAISDIRDARCDACRELVWDRSWSLHEIWDGDWRVICDDCADVLELDWGK